MTMLNISEKLFEKHRKKAREEDKKDGTSDEDLKENPELLNLNFNEKVIDDPALDYIEIQDDGTIDFALSNNLYYFSGEIKLDDDDFCKLIEIAIKKLNKFKNVLESLK